MFITAVCVLFEDFVTVIIIRGERGILLCNLIYRIFFVPTNCPHFSLCRYVEYSCVTICRSLENKVPLFFVMTKKIEVLICKGRVKGIT